MASEENDLDLIWGISAIARLIRRTDRQTFHMASTGQIPVKKIGCRWVADRSKLLRFFMDDAA